MNATEHGADSLVKQAENVTLFVCMAALFASFMVGYLLKRRRWEWMPEATAFLLLGAVMGVLVRYVWTSKLGDLVQRFAAFDSELFFIVLLPPIIFESGYSMKRGYFFANFGSICVYAFLGTTLSAAVIGVGMYLVGQAGATYAMSLLDCLIFGAITSATDPVTVLAVFSHLGAEPNLHALVFGESVLNDAVAIVLYRTLIQFQTQSLTAGTLLGAVGSFVFIFFGSVIIGALAGACMALTLKHTRLRDPEFANMERAMLLLFPYMAYFLAEGLDLSGIVAILFCGIVMAQYARVNMSHLTREFSFRFYGLLAMVAECFVFLYLGMAMFTYEQALSNFKFMFLAVVIVLVSRVFNIVPCSALINRFRRPASRVSGKFQLAMWFSGLRGGVAFALAAGTEYDLLDKGAARIIETATLTVTVFTVVAIGFGIAPLMRCLDLIDKGTHDAPALHHTAEGEGGRELEMGVRRRRDSGGDELGAAATHRTNDTMLLADPQLRSMDMRSIVVDGAAPHSPSEYSEVELRTGDDAGSSRSSASSHDELASGHKPHGTVPNADAAPTPTAAAASPAAAAAPPLHPASEDRNEQLLRTTRVWGWTRLDRRVLVPFLTVRGDVGDDEVPVDSLPVHRQPGQHSPRQSGPPQGEGRE